METLLKLFNINVFDRDKKLLASFKETGFTSKEARDKVSVQYTGREEYGGKYQFNKYPLTFVIEDISYENIISR